MIVSDTMDMNAAFHHQVNQSNFLVFMGIETLLERLTMVRATVI